MSFPLAKGPNRYKSRFGQILEGVFRKDYFTLQTIATLAVMAKKDPGLQIVFGGCLLDLSRRIFEDMIYMEYIYQKGKEKYSKKFIQYKAIEQKNDMDFLVNSGVTVSETTVVSVNEDYEKVPEHLKGDKNWAGQDVERIIEWLATEGLLGISEKETMLKIYIAGNRKNHTSPSDIITHSNEQAITGASERDISLGLMVALGASIKVALRFIEEIENSEEMRVSIQTYWDKVALL